MNELIASKLQMLLEDFGPVRNDGSASHIVKEAIEALRLAPASAEPVVDSWKCFHCAEVFTDKQCAAEHFGIYQSATPGCIAAIQPGGERSILASLRRAEAELGRFMTEDTDSYRHNAAMQCRHSEALERAEVLGYERGLRDGAAPPQVPTPIAEKPTEPGMYAWVPTDGAAALVLVNRRPSEHSPGGVLNGHCIKPCEFYHGAPVESWGRNGKWMLLRPLHTPSPKKDSQP